MKSFISLWLGAVMLVVTVSPSVNAAQPEIIFTSPSASSQMTIHKLREEGKAKRYGFSVGFSSALERPIEVLCGLREPANWMEQAPIETPQAPRALAALPSSFNWKDVNGTTPVKNQQSCGDCWAFGTVGPLESQILLQCKITADLSEQYLTSCNTEGWGCDGGWWAHDYHMDKPGAGESQAGAVSEAAFPFQATDVACGGPYQHPYRISNWAYVSGQPMPSVQAIKQAIYTYGPISAAVYVGQQFRAYSSGIFDANEQGQVNHAIVLVGWEDDLGLDQGYWILRNSWGSGWGEDGYMRIRYGSNRVGYSANYIEFVCSNPSPPPSVQLPDLRGVFGSVTVTNGGNQIAATLRVKNWGTADAGAFKIQLFLSSDGKAKTEHLGAASVSGLTSGQSTPVRFRASSSTLPFSGNYLLAIIDSGSKVTESKEGNNRAKRLIP
jgi:C1A family cysteine protease